jgi:hypothetical protein
MTRFNLLALALLLLAMLAAPRTAHAAQSYDNCTGTITTLPAVIATSGTWCLKADQSTAIASGNAITINSNDVIVDCNGFKLGGLAAGTGTNAYGVYAASRSHVTVRHCNIRGFHVGVYLFGGDHAVEDSRFDGNTEFAIIIQGDGSVVRRNRVFDTGGSALAGAWAFGIDAYDSVDILDNTISGVVAPSGGNGKAFGIYTTNNLSGLIIGNGVRGLVKDGSGTINGVFNQGSNRITMRNNDLVGDGSVNSTALNCLSANGRAMDNTISGFVTALNVCHDSGGNAILP